MRTTIEIDDSVMRKVKRVAAETNRTIRAVIEDALRSDFARQETQKAPPSTETVITFKGEGVRPGINLDSTAELLDVMD